MINKNILIVGGTGTLGNELIKHLVSLNNITVFSRDELKQQELKKKHGDVRFILGDIREFESIHDAMFEQDVVFHVAALKHIDVIERNPEEAIKTNVLGSINVAKAALANDVGYMVFSSTDKAVLPINVYGHTKAIVERYYLDLNTKQCDTKFRVFRWGNVLGSRGSVIHSFVEDLKKEGVVYLTHPEMTRFWIHISEAVTFMLHNYESVKNRVFYPQMKAARVKRVAEAIAEIIGVKDYKIEITGIRPGEKIHECLESNHNECVRSDTSLQLTDGELIEMLREVI